MLPWRRAKPTIDDQIRSALDDVVSLIAEPSVVVPLETSWARSRCEETVLDYLDHNEPGVALEHLIYVVGDADLPIADSTYQAIESAATLMGLDRSKYRQIDPKQDPMNTLDRLRQVSDQTYTVAVKRLGNEWIDQDCHSGPFPGTHLAELAGDDAAPLLDLLNQLEPATQARCHIPRYSLVFWGPDLPVSEVALCFHCNNGRTRSGNVLGWVKFNGQAEPAIQLLQWIMLFDDESEG